MQEEDEQEGKLGAGVQLSKGSAYCASMKTVSDWLPEPMSKVTEVMTDSVAKSCTRSSQRNPTMDRG